MPVSSRKLCTASRKLLAKAFIVYSFFILAIGLLCFFRPNPTNLLTHLNPSCDWEALASQHVSHAPPFSNSCEGEVLMIERIRKAFEYEQYTKAFRVYQDFVDHFGLGKDKARYHLLLNIFQRTEGRCIKGWGRQDKCDIIPAVVICNVMTHLFQIQQNHCIEQSIGTKQLISQRVPS